MNQRRVFLIIILLTSLLLTVIGCSNNSSITNSSLGPEHIPETNQLINEDALKIHFLDVGQADSILVQMPNGQNMLVDAGNNDDGNTVVNYLHKLGVKKIDYLVGTHPHEDHVGGLDTVIQNFNIGKVYMPKVTHTTETFEDVLKSIQSNGLKIASARAGVEILKTSGLSAVMLAPNSNTYEDLNNYSSVIKITYGRVSFLLTGDAEEISESEILKNKLNIKADVLKVGHHGSHSSTSRAFVQAVNPKYAVISVGKDNDYGHPHKETLQVLSNVKVYRSDINGTIIFTTDGKEIKVKTTSNNESSTHVQNVSGKTYVDSNGQGLIKGNINSKEEKIYHMPDGKNYARTIPEKWFKTEAEAQAAGFRPSKT